MIIIPWTLNSVLLLGAALIAGGFRITLYSNQGTRLCSKVVQTRHRQIQFEPLPFQQTSSEVTELVIRLSINETRSVRIDIDESDGLPSLCLVPDSHSQEHPASEWGDLLHSFPCAYEETMLHVYRHGWIEYYSRLQGAPIAAIRLETSTIQHVHWTIDRMAGRGVLVYQCKHRIRQSVLDLSATAMRVESQSTLLNTSRLGSSFNWTMVGLDWLAQVLFMSDS